MLLAVPIRVVRIGEPRRRGEGLRVMLVTMSQKFNLPVGCYCSDEAECHRSVLRQLLVDAGAVMKGGV